MELKSTGLTIACLRKKAGLTQKELAEHLGISDKAISKWERGLSFPDVSYLRQLSILLNVDTDNLLERGCFGNEADWCGILLLPTSLNHDIPAIDTIVYDKPIVDYLLGYFLLAGIRRIQVLCAEHERDFLARRFGDGEKLGAVLSCHKGRITPKRANVMVVFGKSLLYGKGLTRYFQMAMARRDGATILSLVKKSTCSASGISFGPTMKVTQIGQRRLGNVPYEYYYHYVPFLFLPGKEYVCPQGSVDESLLVSLAARGRLYTEALDRGIVEFPLCSWAEVADAGNFVRLIQTASGMRICCLEEIAWRRGLINKEQMRDIGKAREGDYGKYILGL